jgi:hypothetical protein
MSTPTPSWQSLAAADRDSLLAQIASKWRPPEPIPAAAEQPNVTGGFIRRYLSMREVDIEEFKIAI